MICPPEIYPMMCEARALITAGKSAEALPILDGVLESEVGRNCSLVYYERAKARMRAGDLVGAERDFSVALSRWPGEPMGYLGRAAVREAAGDLAGALEDLGSAHWWSADQGWVRNKQARLRLASGDKSEAMDCYTDALLVGKTSRCAALEGRGVLRHEMGDTTGAIEDFTALVELSRGLDEEDALVLRARVWTSLEEWEKAVNDYSEALDCEPECKDALRERAAVQLKLGDVAGAERDQSEYERLLGEGPPALE